MTDLESKPVACIGCGTLNPPGAAACSGCGYAFGRPPAPAQVGPNPAASGRPARLPTSPGPGGLMPHPPRNATGEVPSTPTPPGSGVRIATAMGLIVVAAVCFKAFEDSEAAGILFSLGLIPPSIRVTMLSARRRGEGRPMTVEEKVGLFLLGMVLTYLTAFTSVIAFLATCAPIGLASRNMPVAFGIGGAAALAVAIGGIRVVLRVTRLLADLKAGSRGPRAG